MRWTVMMAAVLLLVATTACSDDNNPPPKSDSTLESGPGGDGPATDGPAADGPALFSCTAAMGTASLSGTLGGKTVSASSAWVGAAAPSSYLVTLTDFSGMCSSITSSAFRLVLGLCDPTPGTYQVKQPCTSGGEVFAKVPNDPGYENEASSGSITIEKADASCGGEVKGTFSLTFIEKGSVPQTLAGSFDTKGCGDLPSDPPP